MGKADQLCNQNTRTLVQICLTVFLRDASMNNLKYLTSQQALADLDAFIQDQIAQHGYERVVLFGGFYGGSLASWYTAKYSSVSGAVVSSAPVVAQVDFSGM